MIARYSLPEMVELWSESHKLSMWTEVEALVVEAWEHAGIAPEGAGQAVRAAAPVDPEAWKRRERITHHDVAAFVDLLTSSSGPAGSWVHYGLTSSDVLDTAQATVLRDAADLLIEKITAFFDIVKRRAFEHRDTVMVGRTHGMWAEPTTFGLKLATWAFELERDHARMQRARESVAVGKISGAVGTYAQAPPAIEAYVCKKLGLDIEPASSQITHRDRHAELIQTIALTGSSIERFATEIRHLQRSELGEVQEPFQPGQKGSSAMPHKRNPILSERMVGLARVLRGYAATALENVSLWHERDISHSSAERVILPDACTTLDYMLATFAKVVDGLIVKPERMRANLDATRGLVFSQSVLLALVDAGLTRDEAYRIVQRDAERAWNEGIPLHTALAEDPEVGLPSIALTACFDPDRFLGNAGIVFDRLEALVLEMPQSSAPANE